jgi:hypothetical protein
MERPCSIGPVYLRGGVLPVASRLPLQYTRKECTGITILTAEDLDGLTFFFSGVRYFANPTLARLDARRGDYWASSHLRAQARHGSLDRTI